MSKTKVNSIESVDGTVAYNTKVSWSNRNILINGEVTRINQREYNGTPVVDKYGYDRWMNKAGGMMTQAVENDNYKLGTVYTLSGDGIPTQQITSPAVLPTDGWFIPEIPDTARNVQLEEGNTRTPFELRELGSELARCHRYYRLSDVGTRADEFKYSMRIPPHPTDLGGGKWEYDSEIY